MKLLSVSKAAILVFVHVFNGKVHELSVSRHTTIAVVMKFDDFCFLFLFRFVPCTENLCALISKSSRPLLEKKILKFSRNAFQKKQTSSIASKKQKSIEMHTSHTWLRLVASSLKNKNFRSSSRILS